MSERNVLRTEIETILQGGLEAEEALSVLSSGIRVGIRTKTAIKKTACVPSDQLKGITSHNLTFLEVLTYFCLVFFFFDYLILGYKKGLGGRGVSRFLVFKS